MFSLSISASHCCFVLVMLAGFWACSFGKGLCCGSSPSLSCALQKGQSGPQLHFSSLGLVECSFVFGSSFREGVVASSFYLLWLDSPSGVASFCHQTSYLTFCQCLAMEYLPLLWLVYCSRFWWSLW